MRLLPLVVLFALVGCNCNGTGAVCRTRSDCGGSMTCLPVGTCAPMCGGQSSSCLAGEKCSTAGGCVPASTCGADGDCSQGELCQLGACSTMRCSVNSCGANASCQSDGHCLPNTGNNPDSCGGQLFQSTHVQANFLIVLDHSSSMMDRVAGTPKWTAAVAALKTVTSQYEGQIRFGLSMFSSPTLCDPGMNYVAVGDMTATQIATSFPATADGNGTPLAGALHIAGMNAGLMDPTRANFVMVVTDGEENCGGHPVTEVTSMATAGIKTFVVGFGGEVSATMLNSMAIAGGTARNTTPRYYQADDPTGLSAAFSQIAQGAIGCDYHLQSTPPDTTKLYVYVNGQLIPKDAAHHAGWDYAPSTNNLTLYGTVCDAVANDPNAKVNIVYGCPDTSIVEMGGDGGMIDLDAGVIIG